MFATIKEVQRYPTDWLRTYNYDRPTMGLGGITPTQKLKRQLAARVLQSGPNKNGRTARLFLFNHKILIDGNLYGTPSFKQFVPKAQQLV
jgi:hypothetical protein